MRNNEKYFRSIIDSVRDIVTILNADGTVRYESPAITHILGYEPEELVGRNVFELVHADDVPGLQDALLQSAGTAQYRIRHKDGSWRALEVVAKSLLDDPVIAGVLTCSRDITELRSLEAQLVLARKMESIGQLAAGIAHEINTPMQYIGDNARFLWDAYQEVGALLQHYERLLAAHQDGTVTPDLVAEVKVAADTTDIAYLLEETPCAIDQLLQGVERVSKIVRAMKEFSHPGSENRTDTNLNAAVETTVTVARNEWKYVSDVELECEPTLPLVSCFLDEFNQVILNLIVNAAHAISDATDKGSKGKGTITISTRQDGEWAEVRVRDTGTGIPAAIRSQIFEPFFTTKGIGKGTGQGLAIAHAIIVNKHRGTINFETEEGKGTTFIVRLPLTLSSSPQEDKEEADEAARSLC